MVEAGQVKELVLVAKANSYPLSDPQVTLLQPEAELDLGPKTSGNWLGPQLFILSSTANLAAAVPLFAGSTLVQCPCPLFLLPLPSPCLC